MNKVEILAPAGGEESLAAAVKSGCDAVYMGGQGFNARAYAQNFDAAAFGRAVEYCHVRGVKVYQTLNTLVFDRELSALRQAVREAAAAGVDALLVQDLGVARIVRDCVPDIQLHASTQAAVTAPSGLELARELGFSRAVLARELSREEIAQMARVSGIESEIFVHGAHCMSISGQCYLSALIGGRSGNRGQCAQPCRLPFAAEGGAEYALSLRDLSLIDRMRELCGLGVAALKIEGRMKRPEYVAAAVTACRLARDGGEPDLALLRSVFSRDGFTSGYYDAQINRKMFGVRGKADVLAAEPALGAARALYKDEYPGVGIAMTFSMKRGQPVALAVADADGHRAQARGDVPPDALHKPTDEQRIRAGLSKLGGTPYRLEALEVELDEGLALPVSAVNVLRRRCLEELDALRAGVRRVAYADCTPPVAPAARDKGDPPALRLRLHSAAQLTPGLLEGVQSMSLPLSALAKGLAEGALPAFGRYVAEIPRIFFPGDEARLTRELDTLREMGVGEAWCGSLSALKLASRAGLCCQGGYSLNVANALSVREIAAAGAADCQLSFELTLTDARKIAADIPLGLLAYGRLPAMAVRNCPIRAAKGCELCRGFETLTDRTGTHFPVDCGGGIAEIYNSVPLNLADRMDELRGFDFVTLYFTDEDAAACLKVLEDYRHGRPPRGKWTRGLYYRGVG